MFPTVSGWHRGDAGLVCPLGPAWATLITRERVPDSRSVADDVGPILHGLGLAPFTSFTSFGTDEGELAMMASSASRRAAVHVGCVLGDGFHALLVAVTLRPAFAPTLAALTRRLVEGAVLGLDPRRPRDFLFTPPPGLVASEARLYRGAGHVLEALPAVPVTEAAATLAHRALRGQVTVCGDVENPRGLRGSIYARGAVRLAVLDDGRFHYPLRMRGDEQLLRKAAASVIPLPRTRADLAQAAQAASPFAD